jgi:hypothetical protein
MPPAAKGDSPKRGPNDIEDVEGEESDDYEVEEVSGTGIFATGH